MASRDAEELEQHIIRTFENEGIFVWNGHTYTVKLVGKPRPSSGECKTDVYILGHCAEINHIMELKISVKMIGTAEFPENKLTPERAEALFGVHWQDIIEKMTRSIEDRFYNEYMIFVDRKHPTKSNSINLGWRIEGADRPRNLAVPLPLPDQEIKDYLYKGTNLSDDKKNAYLTVNGRKEVIPNSGVAEYIIYTVKENIYSTKDVIERLQTIDDVELAPTYFAFKANNYRTEEDKFENRWIAVRIKWEVMNGKLAHSLEFDKPFTYKADMLVPELKKTLHELGKFHPMDMDIEHDVKDPSIVYKKKR